MKFTQIRHGSHLISYKDKTYLVDPVFADQGSMSALPMGRIKVKNPLVDMPFDMAFLQDLDGLILTHLHFDHFDDLAKDMLDKNLAIYCHSADKKKIQKAGFKKVVAIDDSFNLGQGVSLETVNGGQHGSGLRKKMMGRTTGYVFKDKSSKNQEPTLYLTGDTLWCDSVKDALRKHQPEVIIAFAGQAKLMGQAITMGTEDLDQVANHAPQAKIIVNHLDTWNHCYLTRSDLKAFLKSKTYKKRFFVPDDGESLSLGDQS